MGLGSVYGRVDPSADELTCAVRETLTPASLPGRERGKAGTSASRNSAALWQRWSGCKARAFKIAASVLGVMRGLSWLGLVSVMVLGGLSSVLGEMKLFPFALVISGFLAISIYAVRHRQLRVVVTYTTLIIVIVLGFVNVYNLYVSEANKTPFQTYLTDPVKFSQYMNRFTVYSTSEGRATNIGRGAAVEIGWNSIRREPATLLLGYGLGARSESKTLGTTGVSLTTGYTGFSVGTSLLILMQEMGLVGLIVLSCIILWMIFSLVKSIRNNPSSPANGLRYGLLFCSILLPLWLWYSNAWTMRVPMLLYWYLFGYVFAESHDISIRLLKRASLKLAFYTGNM